MTLWLVLYILYSIFVIVLAHLMKRKLDVKEKGLADWWGILSLILPAVGFISGYLLLIFHKKKSNSSFMDEYSQYVDKEVYNFDLLREDLKKDEDFLAVSTIKGEEGAGVLKKMILNISNERTVRHSSLLEKALNYSDSETVHYAATIRNVLHERILQQLEQDRKNLSHANPETYTALHRSYKSYLESGLYTRSFKSELEAEYELFLKEGLKRFPNHADLLKAYGNLVMHKKPEEGEKAFRRALKILPHSIDAELGMFKVFYQQKKWPEVFNLAKNLYKHPQFTILPSKDQETIRLFSNRN